MRKLDYFGLGAIITLAFLAMAFRGCNLPRNFNYSANSKSKEVREFVIANTGYNYQEVLNLAPLHKGVMSIVKSPKVQDFDGDGTPDDSVFFNDGRIYSRLSSYNLPFTNRYYELTPNLVSKFGKAVRERNERRSAFKSLLSRM